MGVTFYTYMLRFLNEDSPRGDLAKDMQYEQEKAPYKTIDDLNEIQAWSEMETHLRVHRVCDEARRTAKRCWQDYRNSPDCA